MIPIKLYADYFKTMLDKNIGIKSVIIVATEPQLANHIREMAAGDFPALIALVPSADSIAQNSDTILEANQCLIYVLIKIDSTLETRDSFIDKMEESQNILASIKNIMLADRAQHEVFNHLLERIDLNRMHTDPEYNYLGCNGWSLSFILSTPGF